MRIQRNQATAALLGACALFGCARAGAEDRTTSSISVRGRVDGIRGHQIHLRSGATLDVSHLPYDPLDRHGYPYIRVGELIEAAGTFDKQALDSPEIVANWIMEVYEGAEP